MHDGGDTDAVLRALRERERERKRGKVVRRVRHE